MLVVVFCVFFRYYARKEDQKHPFGRSLSDRELLVLSLDELRTFELKYLLKMENYVVNKLQNVSDKELQVKWKDLLRRIDIVLDEI